MIHLQNLKYMLENLISKIAVKYFWNPHIQCFTQCQEDVGKIRYLQYPLKTALLLHLIPRNEQILWEFRGLISPFKINNREQSKTSWYTLCTRGWWNGLCKAPECKSLATPSPTLSRSSKLFASPSTFPPQWNVRYCGRLKKMRSSHLEKQKN